jgi:peptidyl-prolyl cis-trans isomerase SurA
MRALLTIFLLSTTIMVSAAFAGDRVVARVANEAITHRELATALEQNPELTRQKALDLLIERRLVLVWAAGKNIVVGNEEMEEVEASVRERNNLTPDQFKEALTSRGETLESFMANIREQLTINKALGMILSAQNRVTDGELQELYLKTYPRKTLFEVSHILLSVEKGALADQDAAVSRKAEQVLDEISGGAPFDSMAFKYSQDESSADKGGRLGTFREGELLPELEELAATLEPGEVGGPVRTSAGYHILILLSKELSEPPPFTEVRSTLERNLMFQKEESARSRWLDDLKKTTYIEIFPDGG